MIPILVSDIRDWFNNYRRFTLLPMIIIMASVVVFSIGRPEMCLSIFLIYAIFIGYICGREVWNKVNLEEWAARTKLEHYSIVIGKLFGTICIGIIHVLFLLPLWIYNNIMWGISVQELSFTLFNSILVMSISACLTMIGTRLAPKKLISINIKQKDTIIGRFFIMLWLIITIAVPVLRASNPFSQIYNLGNNKSLNIIISILVDAGLLFSLSILLSLLLKRISHQSNLSTIGKTEEMT